MAKNREGASNRKNRICLCTTTNMWTRSTPGERGGLYQLVGNIGDVTRQFRALESKDLRVYSEGAILRDCKRTCPISNHIR